MTSRGSDLPDSEERTEREARAAHEERPAQKDGPRRAPLAQPAVRPLLRGDGSLTVLLGIQVLTTFVVIPLTAQTPGGSLVLDVARLVFVGVCAFALTERLVIRGLLLAGLVAVYAGQAVWNQLGPRVGVSPLVGHEVIAATVFGSNALVTVLVARSVFGPGRVTAHRILGAVLVHLNVAILFAIAYELLLIGIPDAIRPTGGGVLPSATRLQMSELSYFSLSTITTMTYGDLAPVHPLARSLANLESLFGQLFPAIFIARLVSLHVAFDRGRRRP